MVDINAHLDHVIGEYEGGDHKTDDEADSTEDATKEELDDCEDRLHHNYPKEAVPVEGIHKTGHIDRRVNHTNDEVANGTVVEEKCDL